jgi:hypothetical protein
MSPKKARVLMRRRAMPSVGADVQIGEADAIIRTGRKGVWNRDKSCNIEPIILCLCSVSRADSVPWTWKRC